MTENEKTEQQANEAVTPPPFRQNEESVEMREPATTPVLADRIAALGLNEETAKRLIHLTECLDNSTASDELLTTLARGITHDDDVNNADAAGYLRGRNDKIDVVMRPQSPADDEAHATPVFPRYCRRSIWDI